MKREVQYFVRAQLPGKQRRVRHVTIRPLPPADLRWARGWLDTEEGAIGVQWFQSAGEFQLAVSLPAGGRAVVILPSGAIDLALQGGHAVAPGARYEISESTTFTVTRDRGIERPAQAEKEKK